MIKLILHQSRVRHIASISIYDVLYVFEEKESFVTVTVTNLDYMDR
jgi:hypothetical protein